MKQHGETIAVFGTMVLLACALLFAQSNKKPSKNKSDAKDTCFVSKKKNV